MTDQRKVVVAVVLWLVFAAVVWNVIFDRLIVLAGRRYSHDAYVLYRSTGRYLLINDVMRPAIAHAVRFASAVAGTMAVVALIAIRFAARARWSAGPMQPSRVRSHAEAPSANRSSNSESAEP